MCGWVGGGGGGVWALTKKRSCIRNLSEKQIMHKKVPEKTFKHACSLNLYMNRYLEIQEKIDLLRDRSLFITWGGGGSEDFGGIT